MNRWYPLPLILAAAAAPGCGPPEEAVRVKAIIGATLIHRGGSVVEDAVVVVRDGRIWAAGTRAGTPIPAGSQKLDARGKYLVPAADGGEVEPGAPAHLALLGNDPRRAGAARARVEKMMMDGEWVDPPPSEP